jgi:hypothetical protein
MNTLNTQWAVCNQKVISLNGDSRRSFKEDV